MRQDQKTLPFVPIRLYPRIMATASVVDHPVDRGARSLPAMRSMLCLRLPCGQSTDTLMPRSPY